MTRPTPMPTIELVHDPDCPNVDGARAELLRALAHSKLAPRWTEWRSDDPASPPHVRAFGSPTILIDGLDVGGTVPGEGSRCRPYAHADGALRGVPDAGTIARALAARTARSGGRAAGGGWTLTLAALPGIGMALLPKVACPACWPAYAGLLSSLGLGFLLDATYLLPLTATFLAVALSALAFRARQRRGPGPLLLGLAASAIVLVGKFAFESDPAMIGGVLTLVAASIWNTWPRQRPASARPSRVGGGEPPTNCGVEP